LREALLDVKEVSGILSVHPKTLYEWSRTGRVPSVTVNGRVRFEQKQIDEFLERRRTCFVDPSALLKKVNLPLDAYDRLHLKGGHGALNEKTRRRWNYGFGSIFLRKTKEGIDRWSIDYRNSRGKRVREVVKDAQTRGEALVALQLRAQDSFNGRFNPVRKAEPMRFARFAEIYLDDYAKTNKKSWRCDFYALKSLLTPYFGRMRLEDISPLEVEKYRAVRLRSVSKSSTNREMALLKVMFNLAIDWGFVSENPLRKVKMFSEKDNLKERILREDEETRLLANSAPHLRPVITGLLMTGARLRELMALRWESVDFERGTILLTKTKAGRNRIIPINAELHELLRILKTKSKSEYVFTGPEGKPVKSICGAFVSACRRAGLKGLRLHDLRHTFATRLIRRGVDIITVQSLLGHSSVTTTQRYTHTGEAEKREAVRRLEPKTCESAADLARVGHTAETEGAEPPANQIFSVN